MVPPVAVIGVKAAKLTFPVPAVIVVTLLELTVAVVPVRPAPRVKAKVFG
jgi:hypothetical protein